MAALARPVRSDLNSRCSASIAPCIRCCTSLMTSLIMCSYLWSVSDDRADVVAEQGPFDVPLLAKRKDVDRNRAVAREVDGGGVHHLQAFGQNALIGGARDARRLRILLRIRGVDAVDFRRLEDDLALQFAGAEGGGGVGGEERVAGAGRADDDALLLQMAD